MVNSIIKITKYSKKADIRTCVRFKSLKDQTCKLLKMVVATTTHQRDMTPSLLANGGKGKRSTILYLLPPKGGHIRISEKLEYRHLVSHSLLRHMQLEAENC